MGDSSLLNNKLSHPDYNNWVKGILILRELKIGLVPFLDEKARGLQQHVLRNVTTSSAVCTACTKKNLKKCHICNTILKDITTEYKVGAAVNLVNTDNQAWRDTARYWEIAKAYISTGGYDIKTSADETDCAGLLTIIINCTWIHGFLSVSLGVFEQVKKIRNTFMHAEENTVKSDQLDQLYNSSQNILKDSRFFAVNSTAQAALARITEIKEKPLSISDIDFRGLLFIVEELKAQQDIHKEAIGDLETNQPAALEIHSQNLKGWQEELEKQQTEQNEAISRFGASVSQLDTNVSQLGKRVSDHHEQEQATSKLLKRVRYHDAEYQQAVSQLGANVSSIEARHPTGNIQMKKGLAELKNYLINTKYKQEILQGEPNLWFKMKDVLQMFEPLEIREDLERGIALSSTERKKARPGQASDGRKIESMRDIFFEGSKRQYKIFLQGKAGVGKSTLCYELVNKWCKVQDSEYKTDDESELKFFSFLFFIQPRCSDKYRTIYEMIKKQVDPIKYHKVIMELLTSHPERCLVLIDGIDEGQSDTGLYQECPTVTILITSRQWQDEALDCNLGLSCRVLEIRGLDSGGIKKLAVKACEAFTREGTPGAHCKPLVNQLMYQINVLKLNSFAQIPFLLIIFIKSWLNENITLENALGFIYSGLIESLLANAIKNKGYSGTLCLGTNTPALPTCFYERQHCFKCSSLIHELSKLAFEMLFSDEKEDFGLTQQLGVKEHCLKLGLLIDTTCFPQTNDCQRSFSFPHKTIQEYFGAVYLCGKGFETGFARYCKRVTSPVEVFEFENVVLFLSGMNLTYCKKLFDYICSLVFCRMFADEEIYPVGWRMLDKVEKIEKLAEQCRAEARHSDPDGSHTGESQFVIPDMVVGKDTLEDNVEQFCKLGPTIKSLVYRHDSSPSPVTSFFVVDSIRTMQYIQRLGIVCSADNIKKYIACICKYLSSLIELNSFSFSVNGFSTVRLPVLLSRELVSKLGKLPKLVSVYLERFDLEDIDTSQFTSQLTSLGLYNTKSLGFVSGWCNQLYTLYMYDVELSPAAVHQLCQYVTKSSSLQFLKLLLANPPDHPTVFDDVLDLTSHTSLHTLDLFNIELKSGVRIHTGSNWREIEMNTVSMSESMWQKCIPDLPTESLQQLDVMLLGVKSLNTQTMSYIRDQFYVTEDTTDSKGRRHIHFNTKH